jgi:hypothetical protein
MDGLYLLVKVIPTGSGAPVVEQVKISANTAAQRIISMVRRW